jgi:phosphoglucosamine mutase
MKKLFGTDGMRGLAGEFPLNAATVKIIGSSLAKHLAEKKDGQKPFIIIGRDTRESGAWIEKALIAGATEASAECESAGVITTPGVAFLTRSKQADAGVVISASHNPYQDNGIKIFSPSGRKLDDVTERLIETDIYATKDKADGNDDGNDFQIEYASEDEHAEKLRGLYLNYLANEFPSLSLDGLRIAVDCANGASSNLAPQLLKKLGAQFIAINNNPNGQNINRDCGSLHLSVLQSKVFAEKADLGVAYDGDADRALFVDAHGEVVDGDAYLWALACFLQDSGHLVHNTVVATVMSNLGLEVALRTRGIKLLRTDVGDKYVLEELLRTESSIGGEQSGHIIFPHRSLAGDGMLTTLYLLHAIRETKLQLHELTAGFTRYPQILINVRVRERVPFSDVDQIAQAMKEIETQLGMRGRLLLRYSGTESLARVMIEGESHEEIEKQARYLASVIKESLGI